MRLSFQFVSRIALRLSFICITLLLLHSCSHKISKDGATLPPIIKAHAASQKYNMQLDFMKHHLSGMLIVRRMPNEEIRFLATTYFGLSIFDFSLQGETFKVNSCIEPMRKENILKLLENDLKNLFLSSKNIRVKKKSSTFERRISGRGFGKSVFTLSEYLNGEPEQVQIKHPWIRLTIQLDRLKEAE